jgi:hypothetical protein
VITLNTYRLSVVFHGGHTWWLKILAKDAEAVTTFIEPDMNIRSLSINLIDENVGHKENDNFICKILQEDNNG